MDIKYDGKKCFPVYNESVGVRNRVGVKIFRNKYIKIINQYIKDTFPSQLVDPSRKMKEIVIKKRVVKPTLKPYFLAWSTNQL